MGRIARLKRSLGICFEAGVTPFLWGHRGVGKSSLFREIAEERGWGFIDLRCSQLEAADLRGLPERSADGRTRFLPPADLPIGDWDDAEAARQIGPPPAENTGLRERGEFLRRSRRAEPRRARGILLLDELNRAPDDVLQAAFQLILDRAVGEYALPPGWVLAAAGNFGGGAYRVNDCDDPAFLDRFCHLVFPSGAATVGEWSDWMRRHHGEGAAAVLDFIAADAKHLDGGAKGGLSFEITPSRRSWDAVARVLSSTRPGRLADSATFAVVSGLIGRELATAFRHAGRRAVEPEDVLGRGVAAVADALARLDRGQLVGLMGGVIRLAGARLDEPEVCESALDFAAWLAERGGDRDLALAFCRDLAGQDEAPGGSAEVRGALVTNPRLARAVARRRGEPLGFLDRLAGRPALQNLLADAAWGAGSAS